MLRRLPQRGGFANVVVAVRKRTTDGGVGLFRFSCLPTSSLMRSCRMRGPDYSVTGVSLRQDPEWACEWRSAVHQSGLCAPMLGDGWTGVGSEQLAA